MRYKIKAVTEGEFQNILGLCKMHGHKPALINHERWLVVLDDAPIRLKRDLEAQKFLLVPDQQYSPEQASKPFTETLGALRPKPVPSTTPDDPARYAGCCGSCAHWHSRGLNFVGACHARAPICRGELQVLQGCQTGQAQDAVWPDRLSAENSCGDYKAGMPKLGEYA